jgi:hypothetical protein
MVTPPRSLVDPNSRRASRVTSATSSRPITPRPLSTISVIEEVDESINKFDQNEHEQVTPSDSVAEADEKSADMTFIMDVVRNHRSQVNGSDFDSKDVATIREHVLAWVLGTTNCRTVFVLGCLTWLAYRTFFFFFLCSPI